jgi:hypothetical protein|uniref:Uncharacterized protein n=1 Tax=Siphoviridae sp. ctrgt10 TaxID=2826479 RepID=A0A8S5M742_9CAUD|nr:MAG TPA: hypothetical protein [Siphoviridae sp. ctrgt10]
MSYSRTFLIQQFKKGIRKYMPIASAAETMINYKLSQLDEEDWARIENFFNSFTFPLHVYRGLNVKSEQDVNFKNPGNNWTVDSALFHAPFSAFRNSNYILEGYIDEDQIDWPETVQNFMYYSVNAANNQRYPENEVTLKKGQVPHDLTGSMKEALTEDLNVPDKPSAQDKFRYYWEIESRAIKQPEDLLRKFKNKFPNQYYIWGELFEWMLEHNEESVVEPQNYALYLEYDLDTNWGYIALVEFKTRYQESLNEVYPQKNETKSDFINRFMRVTAKEYPNVKQRYAVANSYWDKHSKNEAYLDPEEKFWDYRTKEVQPGKYIDTSRSEIGWVDNLIHNIKYFEQNKGVTARIVDMTPEEYFEECATLFHNSVESQKKQIAADTETIEHLTDVIKKFGKRFPIPYINIANNSQEGRHRMYVLGELFGWDKAVPVLIIQDVNNVRVPGKELK